METNDETNNTNDITWLKIPTGKRQTGWLYIYKWAEELN